MRLSRALVACRSCSPGSSASEDASPPSRAPTALGASRSRRPDGARLAVGDSVSIDGCCLTATAISDGASRFDGVPESLGRTSLGRPRARRRGQPRAGAPRRRAARRPLRPGSRRRRRPRRIGRAGEEGARLGRGAAPSSSATASRRARSRSTASRSRSPALDDSGVRGRARPAHARGDDARRARGGRRGQPRGGRPRQVRRETDPPRATLVADDPDGAREDESLCRDRGRDRRHPAGQVRRRRRRRRPRERGRPDDRRAVRNARGDQLHGDARPRADLPLPDRGALRRARRCARWPRTTRRRSRRRSPSRSKRAKASPPASPPQDRSRTIQVAIDPTKGAHDVIQPGHVFPLRARDGGVLVRAGQTEAAVDLARLAGLNPAGVVCEVMKEDGTMARVPDLDRLLRAARHQADHGRRPDRVPAPHREARRAHGRGPPADRATASSPRSRSARSCRASTTSRSSAATSTAPRTCSSACTRSA